MKYFIKLILVFTIVLSSCKNETEPKKESNTPVIPFTEVGNQMRNEAAAKATTQQSQTTTTPNQTTASKGVNPAHGQPNHRCDIPVGAPLNSPSVPVKTTTKNTAAPAMKVTPVATTSENTSTTPTPEGMNPPHGQAGHRCDIAVGAALPKE